MISNFDFLTHRFPELFTHATHAESMAYSAPRASCFYARFTLEQAVLWLYENDPYLKPPYDNNLGALIHEQTFKDNLTPALFPKVRAIQKVGNLAVHNANPISDRDSLRLVEDLFHFLYWLCRYYAPDGKNLPTLNFNCSLIPSPNQPSQKASQKAPPNQPSPKAPLNKGGWGDTQLSQTDEMRRIAEMRQQQTQQELEALKAEIAALKAQNEAIPDSHDYNEAETRRYLIDVLLKESGWHISPLLPGEGQGMKSVGTEVEVRGMPNESGTGKVDYVLWGDDGKPLAIVEAKRTSQSATAGKHQAKLYADCLEQQFDRRPVIFYSNGYQHWIWDDLNYPPREIQGFLKKDELERLIFRRINRKRLHRVSVNANIAGRTYQSEAIRRITETFDEKKSRKALLVMATGTGKTRTAIALIDVLMRANWVKRVLFLADRNALLTQTLRAFKTHLPNVTAIDLTKDKETDSANVVLSTYPTMLNRINNNDGSQRLYGCGHFDLVIVDEAHRSIYKKYRALFDYFDGLLVGLTATPRTEVHRDTYGIFELEPGVPTFAYELSDAIADGYLVPPKGVDVAFKFMRQGIHYADLTEAEREEYEEQFFDEETGEIPARVDAAALNQWLFNANTVDKALELLMERGLKVDGGDRLGKTIIFARNHEHADFIVKRFDKNYPHYNGKFARVIDSYITYAQSLLDDFSFPDKQPTIAVSVDMLDTGVDVPEVVNLVFFKPVYSRVKFNQMIGRGTRLRPDLFGIGSHKHEFLIFDLCGNFDFFSQNLPEAEQKLPETLTTRLVKTRLELSQLLPNDPLRDTLLNDLHLHVATMERDNFLVRRHLEKVDRFSDRDRWNSLNSEDIETISESLASLPNGLPTENILAKRFDLLCFQLQLSILKQSHNFEELRDRVRDLLSQLETKRDIPMVRDKLAFIAEVQLETWWIDVTPPEIETVRQNLRESIKFVDAQQQAIIYTNFKDDLNVVRESNVPTYQTGFSSYQYRKKVEAYIRNNENHVAIAKLKRNLSLTEADLEALEAMIFTANEIESRDRFEAVFQDEISGKNRSLKLFIRKLVGLDRNAAKQAFARYLEGSNFNSDRIRFIENIIDYLTQNGVMDPGLLYEPPFTDLHCEGLDGLFKAGEADQIISIVSSFNEAVGADFGVA